MDERRWSARIVLRYALSQVPAVAMLLLILVLLRRWVDLPRWFFWGLVAFWIAKHVILFPFTSRAYHRERTEGKSSTIGARGFAEDWLAPSGYIRVRGELWQGEVVGVGPPIERGEAVRVREIRKLTFLVQPENEESTE